MGRLPHRRPTSAWPFTPGALHEVESQFVLDRLSRIGLPWGSGKAYTSLGTVDAQFAETKSNKGTVTIDGGTYTLYTRPTTGTGGNRCGSSVTSWNQFYSVRQTARTCGQISITDHFDAWNKAGMTLGAVLEASILVEVGGGTGSVAFPTANVTAQ